MTIINNKESKNMHVYVEVRVVGRADNLLIQRLDFGTNRAAAEQHVADLAAAHAAGGDHSGYFGTIVEGVLPTVDLCADES